jgi:hypothetical protein
LVFLNTLFPPSSVFPLLPFIRRRTRRPAKEEKGNDQYKRTFIEFFLCIYHTTMPGPLWKPNKDRGIGREREYDRKRKKTLTNLAGYLIPNIRI